mmetsp:Transcript_1560/g.4240  ORF Transcript_1560/g.4240 Transcript_1560/m.4240 type:complete len:200 (+) Transcript_1560:674-1273(+)
MLHQKGKFFPFVQQFASMGVPSIGRGQDAAAAATMALVGHPQVAPHAARESGLGQVLRVLFQRAQLHQTAAGSGQTGAFQIGFHDRAKTIVVVVVVVVAGSRRSAPRCDIAQNGFVPHHDGIGARLGNVPPDVPGRGAGQIHLNAFAQEESGGVGIKGGWMMMLWWSVRVVLRRQRGLPQLFHQSTLSQIVRQQEQGGG